MSPDTDHLIRSAAGITADPADALLRTAVEWCRTFLTAPHPDLGRTGAVCPYTAPALRREVLYLATVPGAGDPTRLVPVVQRLRARYLAMAEAMPEDDAELLTLLILLPDLDPADPSGLDALQAGLKDDFVAGGLMIGQFHPRCENPGLWNPDFRPLRSPVPLLAIRRMVVFDLPFLTEHTAHFEAWLRHFAGHLPPRVRTQLTTRVAPVREFSGRG
jgi:hypothetical protein